jgi:hypothetical protein
MLGKYDLIKTSSCLQALSEKFPGSRLTRLPGAVPQPLLLLFIVLG